MPWLDCDICVRFRVGCGELGERAIDLSRRVYSAR